MPKTSAGCLVTRAEEREVLLVHARGASFQKPLFGIPKGLVEEDESFEDAARRETYEETGLRVRIRAPLGTVRQKNGKIVHAFWATLEPESLAAIDGRGRCTPADAENDVCRFYGVEQANALMIPAQRVFLERLKAVRENPRDKAGLGETAG